MDELKSPGKPFEISKWAVQEAWEKVKANKGAPGVDGVSIEEFEADLKNNLYKVWNRMSSGSYFPPPVRAVEIPEAAWRRNQDARACPRRRHSHRLCSDDLGFVVVTHPFHPLNGRAVGGVVRQAPRRQPGVRVRRGCRRAGDAAGVVDRPG